MTTKEGFEDADHQTRIGLLIVSEGDEKIFHLLMCCVGRILAKERRRGGHQVVEPSGRAIRHIVDWMRAAIVRDAAWLSNLDEKGRPKKLLKYPTVDALVAEVDRDMLREAGRNEVSDSSVGTAPYMDLGDGWSMVRLLTADALDYESKIMQHCIGNGAYDDQLTDPTKLFLSMRDPAGRPHVTIALSSGVYEQISGKQNAFPAPRYVKRLASFFRAVGELSYLDGTHGVVADIHGCVHPLADLPEMLEVSGSLWLDGEMPKEKFRLPKVVRAGGYVSINDDVFDGKLERVEAKGLEMSGTKVWAGCEFKIENTLNLRGSEIECIPDNLVLGGNLDLAGAKISELPRGLKVGGLLELEGTRIKELPDDLEVSSLKITGTEIQSLGGIRKIDQLLAAGSKLKSLPADLSVQTVIDISESDVTVIPEGFRIKGQLTATGCKRTVRLPRRLETGHADFTRSSVYMPREFESVNSVVFRASRMGLRDRRITCGDRISLAAAHFDVLPDVIRAREVDLDRMLGEPISVIDTDIDTDVLRVSAHFDVVIPEHVKVRDTIEISECIGAKVWAFPVDAARRYLADRSAFESVFQACNHFGGHLVNGPS
ncbi:PcfJ domain-containing protein [Rhizobium sp. BK176]|uniref:PcfJ domain-containing protein n=1 Tax=Rhizobium sp. BK176 TaxID=2587071 RepID=UPI002168ED0C|nr:PcfJ domain-containing protein [Rhizobium sp. BK176]MCS4090235.1 hypothetical protein [Rhizobium sp. BK176]